MNSKVVPFRREVMPDNIFQMIEKYMHGELSTIHIVGVTTDGRVINTSAGDSPEFIRKHDSIKRRG